jgi:hypothetical protein
MMRMIRFAAIAALLAAACGKGGDTKDEGKKPTEKADQDVLPTVAATPIGLAAVKELNYLYGKGQKPYAKATDLYKKKDWAALRAVTEETLAADPGHLDAHRLLGTALAQLGEAEAATEHLAIAIAGDFVRWGPSLLDDGELADYLATPHGKALAARHGELKAAVDHQIAGGVWVIGRRTAFKWPAKSGPASTRGELYAWSEDAKRFVRLTHTGHQLAGWVRSPSGDEIALVGYDAATLDAKNKHAAPTINAWVETRDAETFAKRGARARFKNVRAVGVYYGEGGQILVDTLKANGRWGLTRDKTMSIDATTGKTAKTNARADAASERVVVTLDETVVSGPTRGLEPTPSPTDPNLITGFTITATGRAIAIPDSGVGDASLPRANPSGTRVAFATWVDPCAGADAAKPTLYVIDGKTGDRKHVLTAGSRFNLRWLSDDRLIYEDGSGGLRIWDATTAKEVVRIGDKGSEKASYGLSGVSASPRPICRKEPLADVDVAGVGDVDDEPLPVEEEPGAEPASTP